MPMWLYATWVIVSTLACIMIAGSVWLMIAQALGPDWGALFKIATLVVMIPAACYWMYGE